MDVLYRLSQFWRNVTAQPLKVLEQEEIAENLNPDELALFWLMSTSDQRHAYRVYTLLRASGYSDAELLAAALLHDVGKIRADLSAWDRTVAVLGETFLPLKAKEWSEGEAGGWRRTFVVRERHAGWGASLAGDAGSREGVIDLILRHQDSLPENGSGEDEHLALLQWADDQN